MNSPPVEYFHRLTVLSAGAGAGVVVCASHSVLRDDVLSDDVLSDE